MGNQIIDKVQTEIVSGENTLLWKKIIAGGFVFLCRNHSISRLTYQISTYEENTNGRP